MLLPSPSPSIACLSFRLWESNGWDLRDSCCLVVPLLPMPPTHSSCPARGPLANEPQRNGVRGSVGRGLDQLFPKGYKRIPSLLGGPWSVLLLAQTVSGDPMRNEGHSGFSPCFLQSDCETGTDFSLASFLPSIGFCS